MKEIDVKSLVGKQILEFFLDDSDEQRIYLATEDQVIQVLYSEYCDSPSTKKGHSYCRTTGLNNGLFNIIKSASVYVDESYGNGLSGYGVATMEFNLTFEDDTEFIFEVYDEHWSSNEEEYPLNARVRVIACHKPHDKEQYDYWLNLLDPYRLTEDYPASSNSRFPSGRRW